MGWTYTGNDKLARAATRLYERRARPCKISPMVFMSDPERTPDILAVARGLPEGATLIYRHFGSDNRVIIAKELREITASRKIQFLLGQDAKLAEKVGADGVHLPERELEQGLMLREQHPNWLFTGAAHSIDAAAKCEQYGLDAAILSPIFASDSKSAGKPIGVLALADIVSKVNIPIIALGGISTETVSDLLGCGVAGLAGVSMFSGRHMSEAIIMGKSSTSTYITQLAQIHAASFSPSWSADDFKAHMDLASDDIVDIVVDEEVFGFGITRTAVDQAEILTIVVAPAHQRKGLGRDLLGLAEACVQDRGADIMFLDVAADNAAAIHLYEKSGYHQCGTRPGYYRREINGKIGRVDAILYKKHLA